MIFARPQKHVLAKVFDAAICQCDYDSAKSAASEVLQRTGLTAKAKDALAEEAATYARQSGALKDDAAYLIASTALARSVILSPAEIRRLVKRQSIGRAQAKGLRALCSGLAPVGQFDAA